MAIKFLSACSLSELEEELLKYIMPAVKDSLREAFDKNNTLLKSDEPSAEVLNDLKENLQVAASMLDVCNDILDYISGLGNVDLQNVHSLPFNIADSILVSFQHCKASQELYVCNFESSDGILQLFKKAQDVHTKFLKWFEVCLTLDLSKEDDITTFNNVLAIICAMGEVLSGMNVKSMVDNWKSYTALTQKYADLLNQHGFSLTLPLKCLSEEITRKMSEILELDRGDVKQISQTMKIINFLIKVALKLCNIFWNILDDYCGDVLCLCICFYRYSPHYFEQLQFPDELVVLVKSVYDTYKPFIFELVQKLSFIRVISKGDTMDLFRPDLTGFLKLLNDSLEGIINMSPEFRNNVNGDDLIGLLEFSFLASSKCSVDFYMDKKLYEELILNMTCTLFLIPKQCYASVELLLLKQILQEKYWPALLAIDIWCLVLRNASLATSLETFTCLAKIIRNLNFGHFTFRPQFVYLKVLIWRIYQMIPPIRKQDILVNFKPADNIALWQILGMRNIHSSQKSLIEPVFCDIYRNFESLHNLNPLNFIKMMESLDTVSSLDLNNFGFHSTKICQIVSHLWDFEETSPTTVSGNNFLKYFIRKLYNITRLFMLHLDNRTLVQVLDHLKQLSISVDYKLLIVGLLNSLSSKNVENTQEKNYILATMALILEQLLQDENLVIRQLTLEECRSFITNSPHEQIINSVIRNLKNTEYDVNNFLQSVTTNVEFDAVSLHVLHDSQFRHSCIMWSKDYHPKVKHGKFENNQVLPQTDNQQKFKPKVSTDNNPSKVRKELSAHNHQQQTKKFKPASEILEAEEAGEVDSLISSIKTEMKSLAKAVKKENLTQKNLSDINYIVIQLQSLFHK